MPAPIHIALTITDSFWALAYATARSISVTSRYPADVHIHICHEGLSPDHKAELDSIATEFGTQLHYYDIAAQPDVLAMSAALRNTRRYPKIVYSRLLLDRILPREIERVLYLDSDVLVLEDLGELFATDLGGLAMGAVLDTNHLHQRLGRDMRARRHQSGQGELWFNGGVLLQDLRKMAEADFPGFARDLPARMDTSKLFFDQDLANLRFANAWKRLNWRYNVKAPGAAHIALGPIILHFTAPQKPWHLRLWRRSFARHYRHVMTNRIFYWQVRERWQKKWYLRPFAGLLPRQ